MVAYLRFQGLRTVIYLDDMLLMAKDKKTLQLQVHQALTSGICHQHPQVFVDTILPDHLPRTPGGLSLNEAVPDRRNCSRLRTVAESW